MMSQKSKEDVSASWVGIVISTIVFTFYYEGNLDMTFLDVGFSSDRGVLTPEEDKKDMQ